MTAPKKSRAVILTRPLEDSMQLAKLLHERGIDSVIGPVISIHSLPVTIVSMPETEWLIVTSRHAIPALLNFKDHPIICIGEATAEVAREAGFVNAHDTGGTTQAMMAWIKNTIPSPAHFLYARAKDISVDLALLLKAEGHKVEEVVVYEAKEETALSDEVLEALKKKQANCVVFYSARSAEIFTKRARHLTSSLNAFCLSEKIAEGLNRKDWAGIYSCEALTTPSMLALIEEKI